MFVPPVYYRDHFQTSDICVLDGKFWEITSDLPMGDTSYTNVALGAHTDNTYFVRRHKTDDPVFVSDRSVESFRQTLPDFNSSISSHTPADQEARRSWSTGSTSRRP